MASRIEIQISQIKKTAHHIVGWYLPLLFCLAYAGTVDARSYRQWEFII